MSEPWHLTAGEAVAEIRAGRLSPAALMESCLERAAGREPETRAFAALDSETARSEAARAAGLGPDAPLAGVPFAVKDMIDTALAPTAYGSPIWAGHRPRADASAVALARRAGGAFLGKTATTEFAAMTPAATTNPANRAHTPGGSSSGSAAAVAEGSVPLAFGTQTGGSVIRPAAFCGVVGYKPSFGTIHRAGLKLMSESLDTIGVFARSVADCALFVGAVTGIDLGNVQPPGRPPRLAFTLGPAATLAGPETLRLMEDVATLAARSGATISEPDLPETAAAAFAVHHAVMYGETLAALAWERATSPELISPRLTEKLDWAATLSAEAVAAARLVQRHARRAFDDFAAGFDAIITPSAPGEAPAGLAGTGDMAFNQLWTALHAACVTIPAGRGPNGLPLGIQIVTGRGHDAAVLAWAEWLRRALEAGRPVTGGRQRRVAGLAAPPRPVLLMSGLRASAPTAATEEWIQP